MKYFLYFMGILFLLAGAGVGHPAHGQSIYSAAGIGDYRYAISTRGASMGGVGLAVNEEIVYNVQNPALGAFLLNTSISSGFHFEGLKISQPNSAFNNSLSRWTGFSFSVKIVDRLGIAGGIVPFSDFNFGMQLRNPEGGHTTMAEGKGGITRGFGGVAFKLFPAFALGLTVSRYFGQLGEEFSVFFSDTDVVDTFNRIETSIAGNNYRLGAYFTSGIFSLGGYYSLASDVTGKSDLVISEVLPPLRSRFPVHMPAQWGIGTSMRVSRSFLLALDLQGNQFKDLKIGESIQQFRNGYQFAAGGEYSPIRGLNPSLLQKIDYRAGISTRELYVADVDGSSVREYTLGFGFGFPFNHQMSRVDLAFELGTRGSKTKDIVQERFLRMTLSLGFREEWFQEGVDRRNPEGEGSSEDGQSQ